LGPTGGLFGGLANPQPATFDASTSPFSLWGGGLPLVSTNQPQSLASLGNFPWSPPSPLSGSLSNAPNSYTSDVEGTGKFLSLNNSPIGPRSNFPLGLAPLAQNPQSAAFAGFPPLQPAELTSGNSNQFRPQLVPQNPAALGGSPLPTVPSGISGYPAGWVAPTGRGRIQLVAGDRKEIDPEDVFEPTAQVRIPI
jgi:hypothetical protein